jgi:hypothetical protein
LIWRASSSIAAFGGFCAVYMLSIIGRVTFSAATHFGVAWAICQFGACARSVLSTGSPVMRASVWDLRLADTCPALRVQSAT